MLGHTGQVCPIFIPTRHSGDTSQEDSLYKAFVACPTFIGKDNSSLSQLIRDNFHELYDMLFDIDGEAINAPKDFYTTLSNAATAVEDNHNA